MKYILSRYGQKLYWTEKFQCKHAIFLQGLIEIRPVLPSRNMQTKRETYVFTKHTACKKMHRIWDSSEKIKTV
jgi:hypothetical protein